MRSGAHASARSSLRTIVIGAVIVVLLAGGAYAGYLVGAREPAPVAAPSPSPCPTLGALWIPPGCPTPTLSPRPLVVHVQDAMPGAAVGERLTLRVRTVVPGGDCVTHTIGSIRVYWSDCPSWQRNGVDVYFFYVEIYNELARPAIIKLANFSIETRGSGSAYPAVSLAGESTAPIAFFPDGGTVPVNAKRGGLVAFDATIDFIPFRLSYFDGRQTMSIRFEGDHAIAQT
ncbi:MAG: hypothetical protein WD770_07135 [Actinomycetota bacterium]